MDFLMHTEDPLDDLLNDVGQDAPGEFEDTICDALKARPFNTICRPQS